MSDIPPYFFSPVSQPQNWSCFGCKKSSPNVRVEKVENKDYQAEIICEECGHRSRYYSFREDAI